MILTSSPARKIEAVMAAAGANHVQIVATFSDDSGSDFTADVNDTQTNGTTPVDVVAAPGAGNKRKVHTLSFWNRESSSVMLTVRMDRAGTKRELWQGTLRAGECVQWTDKAGWQKLDAGGTPLCVATYTQPKASLWLAPGFQCASLTATKSLTSTNTFAVYIGKAERAYASITFRYRVTTAAATITWAELAVARGVPVVAGNPQLTVLGHADVSAVINSTGQKTTSVNVASGQGITAGDDLWFLIGHQATTAAVIRGGLADDLQAGFQAALATRPSLNIGNTQTYTLEGATAVAPWVAINA